MTLPLPARPNLAWLKKTAKQQLAAIRSDRPDARLWEAQLLVARGHGFASWRALKAEVDRLNGRVRFREDGTPVHLPTEGMIEDWPAFTPEQPLRVIVSGCLAGLPVGLDGSSYGPHPHIARLMRLPNVSAVSFCPEASVFGVPRDTPDIHGGDGQDVLDGRARVLSSTGEDWTRPMIKAAEEMLDRARAHGARLAVLMDISAACGSQVIYRGARATAPHQIGQGVAAALLVRSGIAVVSQRDFRTLRLIFDKLAAPWPLEAYTRDHHEIEWYRSYFQVSGT